ncbi:MAG: cysteine desulfurase NifS [Oscillospiraceae bacterium]|nr:cysteine desulfurase NifS [Oscillospiraceae bacterium]
MDKRFIYADNAATTAVSKRVFNAMLPFFEERYGNPSSIYGIGQDALRAVEEARSKAAAALGCKANEVYFTGSGTESDNWAIRSAALKMSKEGKKHIITTAVEHHAVLHTCEYLAKSGFEVTQLPVDENGFITPGQVADAIRADTALVTVMYANNEIGTIMPIPEIAAVCRERGVLFHTDAVQAVGNVEINVAEQQIDMLSVSGHKLRAPKGVGALYIRNGVSLPAFILGGAQERSKRAGTENVPSIAGLGEAIAAACEDIQGKVKKVTPLRDKLIDGILKIESVRLNGGRANRLPGNVNASFLGVEGEALLLNLDLRGICASSGSACTTGSLDPSHVLLALGLPAEVAHGSLRLSLSEDTTEEDVDYILTALGEVIPKIRKMSPLWEDIVKNPKEYGSILELTMNN